MRKLLMSAVAVLCALPVAAQQIRLDFPGLAERAAEEVTVTLDARMLRLAAKFLSGDADQRNVRDVVQKLQGVYVRSYEFEHEGEYDRNIVRQIRSELGSDWQKIVDVKSKYRDNTEIYTQTRGEQITGLVIITAEPKELTIVNIVGPVDLDKLAELQGQFGVPKLERGKQ